MIRSMLFALITLAATCIHGQDVRYTLAAYQTGTTTPLAGPVKIDQTFDVAVLVQDLRPEGTYQLQYADGPRTFKRPRGVFAAYCDLAVDDSLISVVYVQYRGYYRNGRHCTRDANILKEFGAFDGMTPLGTSVREVCRVNLAASTAGTLEITPSVANVSSPAYDTLVYAVSGLESQKIPKDKIALTPLTVEIVE